MARPQTYATLSSLRAAKGPAAIPSLSKRDVRLTGLPGDSRGIASVVSLPRNYNNTGRHGRDPYELRVPPGRGLIRRSIIISLTFDKKAYKIS